MAYTISYLPTGENSVKARRYIVADTAAELPTTAPAVDGDIGYAKDNDSVYSYNGTVWNIVGGLTSGSSVPYTGSASTMVRVTPKSVLALSSWTALNSASGSELPDGSFYLSDSAQSADQIRAYVRTTATAPWTETFGIIPNQLKVDYCNVGMFLRESSSGKIVTLGNYNNTLSLDRWTGYTAYGSGLIALTALDSQPRWFQIRRSGSTLYYAVSGTGANWIDIASEAITASFTTAPNQVGFYCNANNATYGSGLVVTYYLRS